MLVEKSIQIIGGKKLTGTIEVSGAKNAVLKQMILPILSEGVYKIENIKKTLIRCMFLLIYNYLSLQEILNTYKVFRDYYED